MHILAALDTCTIHNGPQFCDEDENDIIPIRMVNLKHYVPEFEDFHLVREAISIADLSSSEESCYSYERDESGYVIDESAGVEDDDIVSKIELEKIRILLRGREAMELNATPRDLFDQQKK